MLTPYDQLAKRALEHLLRDCGQVETEKEVSPEVQAIDVWFCPATSPSSNLERLGLLGRLAASESLFEPYSRTPSVDDLHDCLVKLYVFHRPRRGKTELPRLWILSPGQPDSIVEAMRLEPSPDWPAGVLLSHPRMGVGLLNLSRLPQEPDTLVLRVLGRGPTQRQAIAELEALPLEDEFRKWLMRLLSKLRLGTMQLPHRFPEDEEFLMNTQQTFEEYEQSLIQKGVDLGVRTMRSTLLDVYEQRFGPCPAALREAIETIGDLAALRSLVAAAATAAQAAVQDQILASIRNG